MKVTPTKITLTFLLALGLFIGCSGPPAPGPGPTPPAPPQPGPGPTPPNPPDPTPPQPPSGGQGMLFHDEFEDVSDWKALYPKTKPYRWTNRQKTREANWFQVSNEQAHSGKQSIKFFAQGTRGGNLSKSSIAREIFNFHPGDQVRMTAWFYLPSGQPLKGITLMDLECRDCWGAMNIVSNKSPGMRVQSRDEKGTLYIDRGKLGFRGDHFNQMPGKNKPLPRDRWFKLEWVVNLGIGNGTAELFLDGEKIISGRGTNMGDPAVFKRKLVNLKDEIKYDSFEIGISANPQTTDVIGYLDDVSISVSKGK